MLRPEYDPAEERAKRAYHRFTVAWAGVNPPAWEALSAEGRAGFYAETERGQG